MSKRLKTKEELLAELDGLDLPEQTLATFRRVVNTVEEDLSESERRDYEVDLEKYIKTMGMIRSGREEGWEEGREEGRKEGPLEAAKAMTANGPDIEFIAKCTSLSREETKNLDASRLDSFVMP